MPPGGGGGKADGFTTIKGSDIPSQYVDPNKYYMIQRKIANLTAVGALDMTETTLAGRVDGIIANMPADGAMNLAELVRMEDPAIFDSLFSDEKAALPKLWKLVEAPDANDSLIGNRDNFGVVDTSLQPAAAVPPASLAISSLTADQQTAATRLENVYNSDGDATTVTLADLAQGVGNPGAFTQTEETTFAAIQAVFRAQAVAQSTSTLDVSPGPGTSAKDGVVGPVSFHLTETTQFNEERYQRSTSAMQITFTATQSAVATATPPTGAQVFLLSQDTGTETVFGAGAVPSLPAGVYVFEVWQAGQRSYSSNAQLPLMTSMQQISLIDKLDYTLVSALPLVRNLTAATYNLNNSGAYDTQFTYNTTTTAPPANASQLAVQYTATPNVRIPVGRYSFPQANTIFYVYPNNVLWLRANGQMMRMLPTTNIPGYPNTFNGNGATFYPSSNQLYCSPCGPSVNAVLDASMRDI
jgi:hypothetical protein